MSHTESISSPFLKSLTYLGTWILIAIFSGFIGVMLVALFFWAFTGIKSLAEGSGLPILAIAVVGSIGAAAVSRLSPVSRGEGIPAYIRGVRDKGGYLPFRASIVKFSSALLILSTWGNGGLVGPLGRVVSGFTSGLMGIISPGTGERSLRRTAAICGLASVIAAVTGAPIGSGIFAVEIIQRRNMRYSDLFPAILTGSVATFIAPYFNYRMLFDLKDADAVLTPGLLPGLLTTALLAALAGRAFELFYGKASNLMRRESKRAVEVRFALATVSAVGITLAINPGMLGTGRDFLDKLFSDPSVVGGRFGDSLPFAFAALIMVAVRGLSVGTTVASGQSAGFFSPLAQMGMLIGTLTAFIFGRAGNPGDLHVLQAAGLAGLIASSLNVPLAAAVIVAEVFGPNLGFPAALAAVLGFQINRHHTIYDINLGEED